MGSGRRLVNGLVDLGRVSPVFGLVINTSLRAAFKRGIARARAEFGSSCGVRV